MNKFFILFLFFLAIGLESLIKYLNFFWFNIVSDSWPFPCLLCCIVQNSTVQSINSEFDSFCQGNNYRDAKTKRFWQVLPKIIFKPLKWKKPGLKQIRQPACIWRWTQCGAQGKRKTAIRIPFVTERFSEPNWAYLSTSETDGERENRIEKAKHYKSFVENNTRLGGEVNAVAKQALDGGQQRMARR